MNKLRFVFLASLAAFLTYFSMYAFRKPFSAGLYEGIELWGIDYKILLVTLQLVGYASSKVIGIRFISQMPLNRRAWLILAFIGSSWLALLVFALIPAPYNFWVMFFNGLPLGLIWGIVFSFIEGRRFTELLAAALSVSFIVSSGFVKTVGRWVVDSHWVSEFWMPFLTASFFIPVLAAGVWMLTRIPAPTTEDIAVRQPRDPMTRQERRRVIRDFAPGLILTTLIYLFLTIFRDIRDNFAVDIWKDMGYLDQPELLTTSELIIAVITLIFAGSLFLVRNNWKGFAISLLINPFGGGIILVSSLLLTIGLISPVAWMIMMGLGMYVPYIIYHTMLLERWIAVFEMRSNVGFLMYMMDAAGYLVSLAILIFKNYFRQDMTWGSFFEGLTWVTGSAILLLGTASFAWFSNRYRKARPSLR